MDFHNFDIGLLVALDALLTEKSVTRAGERLHLSQPATSILLGRLRQYFGNALLVPSGRRMILTPLAESLVQPVRSCLIQIQHTVASKTEFNPAASDRKFCLAVSDYVAAVLMPQVLEEIARLAPRIRFELVRLDEGMDQRLENGDIDFLVRPSIYAIAAHPKELLFEDTHTCIVWRKNSLIGSRLARKQFLSAGHIAVHFGHAPAIFEGWFAAHYGQLRNIEVAAQDFEVACRLVVGTNRIATVLSRMARLCATYLPIRLLSPPFAIPRVVHCLQWHRYQDQDPGHIWIRSILKEAAANLGPAPRSLSEPHSSGKGADPRRWRQTLPKTSPGIRILMHKYRRACHNLVTTQHKKITIAGNRESIQLRYCGQRARLNPERSHSVQDQFENQRKTQPPSGALAVCYGRGSRSCRSIVRLSEE